MVTLFSLESQGKPRVLQFRSIHPDPLPDTAGIGFQNSWRSTIENYIQQYLNIEQKFNNNRKAA